MAFTGVRVPLPPLKKMIMYELRDYQKKAVDAALKFLKGARSGNGLLVLPTGSGKSLIIAAIVKELDEPTLIFQPSKEILEQNYRKLKSYGVKNVGIFSASKGRKDVCKYTYATIGSVRRYAETFQNYKYILIDECHGVNSSEGMYKKFIEGTKAKIVGLTATPYRLYSYREMGSILKILTRVRPRIFTQVLYAAQVRDLLERGFLAQLNYYSLNIVQQSKLKVNSTGADFTDDSVRQHYKAINYPKSLCSIIQRLLVAGRTSILVFTRFLEEADEVTRMLGDTAAMVSGDTPNTDRERLLDDFQNGKIKVVVNVGVLTTGFDYPALKTVVLGRPTMSLSLYYQMVGRAIRPYNGEVGWIVDLCGNYNRFGKVEDLEFTERKPGLYEIESNGKKLTSVFYGKKEVKEVKRSKK